LIWAICSLSRSYRVDYNRWMSESRMVDVRVFHTGLEIVWTLTGGDPRDIDRLKQVLRQEGAIAYGAGRRWGLSEGEAASVFMALRNPAVGFRVEFSEPRPPVADANQRLLRAPSAREVLISNERVRLQAAALDRLSTLMVTAGVATPAACWVYDPQKIAARSPYVLIGFVVWISLAMGRHSRPRAAPEAEDMIGADVFVLFGIPAVIGVFGAVIYLLADRSARRSERLVNELRRQETEEAADSRVLDQPARLEAARRAAVYPLP
jgi:hypothetical protein